MPSSVWQYLCSSCPNWNSIYLRSWAHLYGVENSDQEMRLFGVGNTELSEVRHSYLEWPTTSTVQWIRLFHDHHSLYITIAYCILMGRFYKKFLSEKIFHWFVYFVVSFRSIRVNIFTVNIIRGHSKSTFIIGAGGGGGSLKSQQKRTGRGGSIVCVYVLFFLKKMLRFPKWSFIVIVLQFSYWL